jgi:hypothetical protein
MNTRAWGLGIVLVLGAHAGAVCATGEPGAQNDALARYKQKQLETYDALTGDSSPRIQVLAGRLGIEEAELHLRPKRAEVVARAANLAPDDVFVQWVAADTGNYWSSQCGPVSYPEDEVATLAALEPDNAAALSYVAALAQAKGDSSGVDDALARMASAKRADDHLGEEIAAWRTVYLAHPGDDELDGSMQSPEDHALTQALMRVRSSSASYALQSACKPDAHAENAWQRLGRCVDAGLLLAQKGNSFALRDEGIEMLEAAGATSDDLAELRRNLAWLKSNSASFMQNGAFFEDSPESRASDWSGAPSEIGATMRRLARLGLPSTPPSAWAEPSMGDEESADDVASTAAWHDYLNGLVDDMRRSADVREKALALASSSITAWVDKNAAANKDAASAGRDADRATLISLAASHRDDALVNWIATTFVTDGTEADAATLANLQRTDSDNAAVWALSFGASGADADATLAHMAASRRYDEHYVDLLGIWDRAVARHGLSDTVLDAMRGQMPPSAANLSSENARATISVMFATMGSVSAIRYQALAAACAKAEGTRRASCVTAGRLMFDGGHSLLTARIGQMQLRTAGALDANDMARVRQLDWWTENMLTVFGDGASSARYVDDTLASKSEIEAMRRAMARAGKLDPPAEWKSAAEQREAKTGAK